MIFGYEELKLFDFSGLEGNGWIEKINPENPRIIEFVIRTSLGELIKNGMVSIDFLSLTYGDMKSTPQNTAIEMPFIIKLPVKIYGVKTLNRMKAFEYLETNFLPSSPLILPSIITLQKASTESVASEIHKDKDKKGRSELGFKILSDKCRKTRLHLVKLFFRKRPFEEIIDKIGSDGFVPHQKRAKRKAPYRRQQQQLALERKKVFLKPKKTPRATSTTTTKTTTSLLPPSPTAYYRADSALSPRKCISGSGRVASPSLEYSLSFSKISHFTSTTITSSSSESPTGKRLKRVPPIKTLPPLRIDRK